MPAAGLLLLVDLDGVLYRGSQPVEGVAALLSARAAAGDDVVYVTNNSMWYREEYVERIAAMGAPVSADRIVSSPRATALYLRDHEPSIDHVLTLGAEGLERELADAGFRVTRAADVIEQIRGPELVGTSGVNAWEAAGRPGAAVVGLDPAIEYLRLAVVMDCVRAGATFIATNRDPVYPTEGAIRPGAGSILAAIEAATGVRATSIGKPEPYLLEEAARAVGREPGEAVMIGDNLATDIAAAAALGARSVLMLTGVTTRAEADAAAEAGGPRPTAMAADADELAEVLASLSR